VDIPFAMIHCDISWLLVEPLFGRLLRLEQSLAGSGITFLFVCSLLPSLEWTMMISGHELLVLLVLGRGRPLIFLVTKL
jgi:hypothetical protein